jgi:hypothetical protein
LTDPDPSRSSLTEPGGPVGPDWAKVHSSNQISNFKFKCYFLLN